MKSACVGVSSIIDSQYDTQ